MLPFRNPFRFRPEAPADDAFSKRVCDNHADVALL